MNKLETISLFSRCPQDSLLFEAAQNVLRKLIDSKKTSVVIGDFMPCEQVYRTYRQRLEHASSGNEIAGLEETVQMLAACEDEVQGGYIETDADPIYFWVDRSGTLVGCVL
jgi:hypothetical protein